MISMKMLLVDLDCTLYPPENELFSLMGFRISKYIQSTLGVTQAQADILRDTYWKKYGLTLIGLMQRHSISSEDFLHYVHDIDIKKFVHPNPQLAYNFKQILIPKILFTNSCRYYAHRVLSALCMTDCFDQIIDIRDMNFFPKPHPKSYQAVLKRLNISGKNTLMIDDTLENLHAAKSFHMKTMWIGNGKCPDGIDAHAKSPNDIPIQINNLLKKEMLFV
ncbi:Pyrimidine 5-nucleotidase [Candidatus Magnetomorum sp. HK-1]|nr:Pyrimidine 5-nucleotidase [Candidatus Magnetomorum sp. HK-1]